MHSIRTYIICCSIMLAAWLAASYSTQLDSSRNRSNDRGAVGSITGENQENKTSTTPLREENGENATTPIAHVK